MRKGFSSIYLSCPKQIPYKDLSAPEMKLSTVQVDFEGRSVNQSKYVLDDPRQRYVGMKPSDFSLENQLVVGVEQKFVQYNPSRSAIESEISRVNNLTLNDFENEK